MRLFFLDNYAKAKIKNFVQAPFYCDRNGDLQFIIVTILVTIKRTIYLRKFCRLGGIA